MSDLLVQNANKGLYCKAGDFYIDPWRPTKKALITHAHGDHARPGQELYVCHVDSEPVIRLRLGADSNVQTVKYNDPFTVNGVKVSFHPAGHIIGSAQIRLEHKGEVWVVSGDYKLAEDGLSPAFETVKCHTFITESTFGIPVFKWKPQEEVFNQINNWWRKNAAEGKNSILTGYSLGKAQRLVLNVDQTIGEIYAHGTIYRMHKTFTDYGIDLPTIKYADPSLPKTAFQGALIIAPPSALMSTWVRRFEPYETAVASGWMQLRGAKRRRAADVGFVLSDHADWDELNTAVKATGAERVFVTHGYTEIFAQWLREQGYDAHAWQTEFKGESIEVEGEEEKV